MEYLNETMGYLSLYGCFNQASTPFGRLRSRNGFKVRQCGPTARSPSPASDFRPVPANALSWEERRHDGRKVLIIMIAPLAVDGVAIMLPLSLLLAFQLHQAPTQPAKPLVLLFVRTDCPISNRYAPELERIYEKYSADGIDFRTVYPEPGLSSQDMDHHRTEYGLKIPASLDPYRHYVNLAKASVTPEAAVFVEGKLIYRGRIDNWYIDIGKSQPKPTEHSLEDVLRLISEGKIPAFRETRPVGCVIEPPQ